MTASSARREVYAVLIPILGAGLVAGCGLPWDPEGTLDAVRGGTLRVGVVDDPPWAGLEGGEPRGVEVALVEQLAEELGATIRWVSGGESELMETLENFGLDLVIGGLTEDTPWKDRVALTRPYYESEWLVGGPKGSPVVEDLSDRRVAVRVGGLAATLVRDEGGEPVEVDDVRGAGPGLVAAPRWQVQAWDLEPLGPVLETRAHVLAVPPGENGWLLHVDRFLSRRADTTPGLLHAEAAR